MNSPQPCFRHWELPKILLCALFGGLGVALGDWQIRESLLCHPAAKSELGNNISMGVEPSSASCMELKRLLSGTNDAC